MKMVSFIDIASKFGVKLLEKKVFESGSMEFTKGMLQGLFDSDGTMIGTKDKGFSVRLSQINVDRLEAVQRLLFGIWHLFYHL